MLYHLLYPLKGFFSPLNIFRYITFRTGFAIIASLIVCFIIAPLLINYLKSKKIGERIRKDGPQSHLKKSGTPTMGGLIIIASLIITILLSCRLDNLYVILALIAIVGFGAIGFVDDYLKLKKSKGLAMIVKLIGQFIVAIILSLLLYYNSGGEEFANKFYTPLLNYPILNMGVYYIIFSTLVIVFSSNAVNLTDGLDGLAIGLVIIAAIALMGFSYVSGNFNISSYLKIPFIKNSAELTIVCGALIGAGLGFLWFNSHPAQIFMGDTGSLPLGGVLGLVAVMTKKEVQLFIIGGIFIIEALSVILQVFHYKLTKRRIFRMAPIHHHFELEGTPESKLIIRFWIIGIILALVSLSTLKIR